MLASQLAWAQQGGNGGTGDAGYSIWGESNPKAAPDTYVYEQLQPTHDPRL